MNSSRRVVALSRWAFGAVLLSLAAGYPAASPDLTGTWEINLQASDFGMSPPVSTTLIFERADEQLVLTRVSTHDGTERTTQFDMPTDGELHQTSGTGPTQAKVEWDGDVLVLWVVVESNMGNLEVTERITAPEGGNTLRLDRTIAVPNMGNMEQTLEFDRAGTVRPGTIVDSE
jgi:hypothetical protein